MQTLNRRSALTFMEFVGAPTVMVMMMMMVIVMVMVMVIVHRHDWDMLEYMEGVMSSIF